MRKVVFFMMSTLNGFYERGRWDVDPTSIDWHTVDDEFNSFAIDQLGEADTILFGRITYEGMATYWPTPEAIQDDSAVAEKMNTLPKVVFSHSLDRVDWQNSRLVRDDAPAEVRRLKEQPGRDIIILASSDLAASLAQEGLIDEYRVMVNPVLLGQGKPMLAGLAQDIHLTLLDTRIFPNGNVLLTYAPATPTEEE
jgi:dihydrofolate reductase